MRYAAAAIPVAAYDYRGVPARAYGRTMVGGAVLGLGSVSAVALMAGAVTVTAAWMVSGSLSRNPDLRAAAPFALQTPIFPRPEERLAAPPDMFGAALASTNPAYAPEGTSAASLAPPTAAAAVAPARRPQAAPEKVASSTSVPLPSPRPLYVGPIAVKTILYRVPSAAGAAAAPDDHFASYDVGGAATAAPAPQPAPEAWREQAVAALAASPPAPAMTGSIDAAPSLRAPAVTASIAASPPARTVTASIHVAPSPPAPEVTGSIAASPPARTVTASIHVAPSPPAPDVTGSINVAPQLARPAVAPARTAPRPAAPQLAYNNPDVVPEADSHTAIYDIAAHTVYLPDGERLEAHSGLGRFLDDPRYVSQKARGPTPPNTYDLTLRSGLFHGVQALRLNPVADGKMYGRDGILAHTYMLGPSGQSFGCVSFKNYGEFLRAFQRGEVRRMVVVPHLQAPPPGVRAQRDGGARYALNSGGRAAADDE
jgi:hypothetical protein